jgi:ketosteroid isomerase-like protein
MKTRFTLLLLLITTVVFAQKKQTQQIATIEQKRYNAMIAADTALVGSTMANDCVYYHSNGMLDTKQSLLTSIASKELVHKKIDITQSNTRIYKRNTAIVNGKCIYDITYHGTEMQLQFVFTNVYTKHRGKWLLVHRQTTKLG